MLILLLLLIIGLSTLSLYTVAVYLILVTGLELNLSIFNCVSIALGYVLFRLIAGILGIKKELI